MTWRIVAALALITAGVAYYAAKHRQLPAASANEVQAIVQPPPILVAGVNEPEEMHAEPVEPPHLSEADKALGAVLNNKGKTTPADYARLVDPVIASYPDYAPARVMRLCGLCEIPNPSNAAIASDIDVALKNADSAPEIVSRPSLLAMRAKLEYVAGQDAKAITDLESAVSADEESPFDIFNNGGVKPGDHPSSTCMWTETDLNALVKSFPIDYRAYLFRGLFYSFFALYDEPSIPKAQEDLQHAIQLNEGSARLHFYLANVELHGHFFKRIGSESVQKAENPAILRELDRAIDLSPKFKPALAARAELYFQEKQYANTIADYGRVLELDPDNTAALHDQALARLDTGDTYGAISGFTKAIEKIKEKKAVVPPNAYENLGDTYLKAHQNAQAIEAYTNAIGAQIGQSIYLMSLAEFRRIFPEYASASNEAVMRKIQKTYFPQIKYGDFAKSFDDPGKKPFETFLIKDLYLKRADTYLLVGKYYAAATDFERAVNSFETYGDSVERWHTIQSTPAVTTLLDLKSADFAHPNAIRVWIKQQRGSGENTPYQVQQYEVNCVDRQIKMLSAANYSATGELMGSQQGNNTWGSIIPDSLGETLSNGMCTAP